LASSFLSQQREKETMRAIIVSVMIAFTVQVHAKEVETNEMTDVEAEKLIKNVVDKLSDRLLRELNLQDSDMDGTTLGKPGTAGQLAAPSGGLATATHPDLDRRSAMSGLAAMMPLVAIMGQAFADDNAYINALLEKSKANKEKNDAGRLQQANWNSKRYSIELKKASESGESSTKYPWKTNTLVNMNGGLVPDNKGMSGVWKKQAEDQALAKKKPTMGYDNLGQ